MILTIEILLDDKVYTYIEDYNSDTFHLLYYDNHKLFTQSIEQEQDKYDIIKMVGKIHYNKKES